MSAKVSGWTFGKLRSSYPIHDPQCVYVSGAVSKFPEGTDFMATHRENFESWFVKVLKILYPYRDAGFVIIMTAFPLLERYLRGKAGLAPNMPTDHKFNTELLKLFPELGTENKAKEFWQVYRHGLLHQVTFSETNQKGASLSVGRLSHDGPIVSIELDGSFWVNPVTFAKRVTQKIMDDFLPFENAQSSLQLPVVEAYPAPSTWNNPPPTPVLGTGVPSNGSIILGTGKKP